MIDPAQLEEQLVTVRGQRDHLDRVITWLEDGVAIFAGDAPPAELPPAEDPEDTTIGRGGVSAGGTRATATRSRGRAARGRRATCPTTTASLREPEHA